MLTTELCDLSGLIHGWFQTRPRPEAAKEDMPSDGDQDEIDTGPTAEDAVPAIDAVLKHYPQAIWIVSGEFGRIIAGEVLLSLKFSLIEPDAELRAWIDTAGRLPD